MTKPRRRRGEGEGAGVEGFVFLHHPVLVHGPLEAQGQDEHGQGGNPQGWLEGFRGQVLAVWEKRMTPLFTTSTEPCNLNFTDPEANIEILLQLDSGLECNYLITVYLGYGIEVQVSALNCNG